jgi:hypothetical protein
MAEIRTVTTLRYKRAEIEKSIAEYEKRIAQATADLSHINAAISIFEASGDPKGFPAYVDLHRLFKRGEPMLAKSVGLRLIHALRLQNQRGLVRRVGKSKAALIWELPPEKTLV